MVRVRVGQDHRIERMDALAQQIGRDYVSAYIIDVAVEAAAVNQQAGVIGQFQEQTLAGAHVQRGQPEVPVPPA